MASRVELVVVGDSTVGMVHRCEISGGHFRATELGMMVRNVATLGKGDT